MPLTQRPSSRSLQRRLRPSPVALAYRAQVIVAGAYSRGSHSFQLQLLDSYKINHLFKITHLFITSVYPRSVTIFLRFS